MGGTTIGAALVDTATEVSSGAAIAVTGTILAALFSGALTTSHWSSRQTAEFQHGVTVAALTLTVVAAVLVGWGMLRSRRPDGTIATPVDETLHAPA